MLRGLIKPADGLLLVAVLAPLAIAVPRLADVVGVGVAGWLRALASAAGILGLSAILVSGAVSARIPGVDRYFGGLTRLWHLHHILGFVGFMLVMAHVLLLAGWGLTTSLQLAVATVFPSLGEWAVWVGWGAYVALVVFLAPSFKFFGEPRYQWWKRVHLVAALALALASLHAILLARESLYWWALGGLAIGAVAWRKVGSRLASRRPYQVERLETLAPGMVELTLRAGGRPLSVAPGQFVYLSPTDQGLSAGRNEEHPYSVSQAGSDVLRVGIRDLGDASHALQKVAVGSRVWLEGPYGCFFERSWPGRGQLWIGGGVGVTPFVSGARALRDAGEGGDVCLVHLADRPEKAFYGDELAEIAESTAGFRVRPHYFRSEGPLTAEFLEAACQGFAEREAYICGSPEMLKHVRRVLRRAGVPLGRIHSEEFNLL